MKLQAILLILSSSSALATPCDEMLNRMYFDRLSNYQLSTHAAMDPLSAFSMGPLQDVTSIKGWLDTVGVKTAQLEVNLPGETEKHPALQILPDTSGALANHLAAQFKEGAPNDPLRGNIYYVPNAFTGCRAFDEGFHRRGENIYLRGNVQRIQVLGQGGFTDVIAHELWHAWLNEQELRLAATPSLIQGNLVDDRMSGYPDRYDLEELLTHSSDVVMLLFRIRRGARDLEKLATIPNLPVELSNNVKADMADYKKVLDLLLTRYSNHADTLSQILSGIRTDTQNRTIDERLASRALSIQREPLPNNREMVYLNFRLRPDGTDVFTQFGTNLRFSMGSLPQGLTNEEIMGLTKIRLSQFEENVVTPIAVQIGQIRVKMDIYGDTPEKPEAIEVHRTALNLLKSLVSLASKAAMNP